MSASARIARFIDEVAVDRVTAERELLADLRSARGPLIEVIPGERQVLVTFVCIRDSDAVSLRTPLAAVAESVNLDLDIDLERVPGTNVWYASVEVDSRIATSYQFRVPGEIAGDDLETEYTVQGDPAALKEFARAMVARGFADAQNPERLFPTYGVLAGLQPAATDLEVWESTIQLHDAEPFPHLDPSPERGSVIEYPFASRTTSETRTVAIYLPAFYDPSTRYPLVLFFDGEHYRDVGRMPEILDHAIASGRIPPLIAVFWHNRDASSRTAELTCTPELRSTMGDELWPWLDANFSITRDPRLRIVSGFSLGGLASLWVGLERSQVFGSVLAVSPSLWFSPHDSGEASGWLTRQYAASQKPLPAVYLAVGSLEVGSLERAGSTSTMVGLARELRDVLQLEGKAKAHYREEPAGHDYINVRRATVHGLAALLGSSSR